MSRVEPKEHPQQRRETQDSPRRQPVDRTPGKAEGTVRDVEEALKRQDEK